MTTIAIDQTDVLNAADFLEQYLTDQVPDGDFSSGTALRDLSVQAIAAVVAFLRAEAAQVRQTQSLVTVGAAITNDAEALTDAVTAILSNFLVTPKGGTYSRGFAIGHATQQVDVFITPTIRFTRSPGIIFLADSTDTLFIPKSELIPIIDADSTVLEYEFRIPLVAAEPGVAYNIDPGLFAAFDRFNPYVSRIDNPIKFSGGKGAETVDEILARAPTAVSVRNLINARSIDATLEDNFDGIETILVLGMGEPEMRRDIVPTIAPNLLFHVGGAVDIYLRTALAETVFTGAVGDLYARPDNVTALFRDGSVSFASVLPGDIIRITEGLPSLPAEFLVVENQGTVLVISEQTPFPVATDEGVPPTTVSYTIGTNGPAYNDRLADTGFTPYTTGSTSRRVATPGRITLPGGPVMDILDVAIIDPSALEVSFKSLTDGFVHFPNHVNTTPEQSATPTTGLQFQTIVHNPLFAQSSLQWMEVIVGTDALPTRFDTFLLRVRYRTLASFGAIDSFVRGERERVSAAFQLAKGQHPVTVSMVLTYTLKATAAEEIDDTLIAQTIVDYINQFDPSASSIDVSSIIQLVKNTYPTIANIIPTTTNGPLLTIDYSLRAPTGDVMGYTTNDVVEVDVSKQVTGPALTLLDYGVSDRTLRYIADTGTVVVVQGSI